MKVLVLCLVVLFQITAGAEESVEAPSTVNERLSAVHDKLYNLDYRKLSIEDFTVYTKSLSELKDLSEAKLCSNDKVSKVTVFEDSITYNTPWRNCTAVNVDEKTLKEIEANGVRQCYKENFTECTVKEAARVSSHENLKPNLSDAKCIVRFDVVISGSK